jgi:UDP-N-acetylglucosamine acyltransferase
MSNGKIDARAAVSPGAKIGAGTEVGAFAVVGAGVELGEGCVVHPHAVVNGPSKFGGRNVFHPFCVIGGDPQDYTFRGEHVELLAGDGNVFREHVTINRGTKKGGGITRIGNDNFFLAYSHVGHDCRLGRYAYIGACTVITQDVLPFALIVTERETRCFGPNTIGLERKGFSPERIQALQRAFRLMLRSKRNTTQALDEMRKTLADSADVQEMIAFAEKAERGIVK